MTHLRKRRQTSAHLQIRIEAVLLRTGARRLGMKIAFGHAQVVGAKQAIARARPGLGDDGNGRHARGRSARLHTQHLQQLTFQIGIDIPPSPTSRFLTFNPLVKRQQSALGQVPFVGTLTARLGMYQFDERLVVHGLAATQGLEYVQNNLFHDPIVKAKAPEPISASAPSSNSATTFAGLRKPPVTPNQTTCRPNRPQNDTWQTYRRYRIQDPKWSRRRSQAEGNRSRSRHFPR